MAKAPVAGRVKTRLARQVGTSAATFLARHATAALLQRVARDPRWQTMLALAPDARIADRFWPRRLPRMAQGSGDLGARMQRIMDRSGRGPVVIVGTDIPGIAPAHIAEAFRLLGSRDAVFGPAMDGGYWLVGLKRRPRVLQPFGQVRWSNAQTLGDTLANLEGRSVGYAATLADVDDASALAGSQFSRRIRPRG